MTVTLIATGGTIASTIGEDGAATATRSGADLLGLVRAELPELDAPLVEGVEVVDLPVPGSWNMSGAHALRIALAARDALLGGAQGVVVTHGTDVLEETAFLIELVCRSVTGHGPVVLTASMRNGSEPGFEGPRNLADALRVAGAPVAAGRGALVCVNGEVHHARWVVKTHATALDTFRSPGRGPLGEVDTGGVRFHTSPPPAPPDLTESGAELRCDATVPIVVSHADTDEALVPWHLDRGARGLVVEAGGAGNVNVGLVPGLERALGTGVPVVVASRCRAGAVTPTYGGAGGFATLGARGAISSRGLTAGKARLALQLALSSGVAAAGIGEFFAALADERAS